MENLKLKWGFHTLKVAGNWKEGELDIDILYSNGYDAGMYLNKEQVASLYKHLGQVMRNGGFGYLIDDDSLDLQHRVEIFGLKAEIVELRSQLELKTETPEGHLARLTEWEIAIGSRPSLPPYVQACGNCKHFDNGLCRGKYSDKFLTQVNGNEGCSAFYHKDND